MKQINTEEIGINAMSKLRESAKGQPCLIRLPNHCEHNTETTVLCHLYGGGMGKKQSNAHGSFGCASCHAVVDGRAETDLPDYLIKLCFFWGMVRTQQWWLDNGYISIMGEEK